MIINSKVNELGPFHMRNESGEQWGRAKIAVVAGNRIVIGLAKGLDPIYRPFIDIRFVGQDVLFTVNNTSERITPDGPPEREAS